MALSYQILRSVILTKAVWEMPLDPPDGPSLVDAPGASEIQRALTRPKGNISLSIEIAYLRVIRTSK